MSRVNFSSVFHCRSRVLSFSPSLSFSLVTRPFFDPLLAINASNLASLASLFCSRTDYAALSLRAIDNLVPLKGKIVSFDERNLRAERKDGKNRRREEWVWR